MGCQSYQAGTYRFINGVITMANYLIEKNGVQLVVHELVVDAHAHQGWTVIGEYTPEELPDIANMTVDELKQFLTDHNVDYDDKAKKAELVELAEASQA